MPNIEDKIKTFKINNKTACIKLVNWKNLQSKDFTLDEMLKCIYNFAKGSVNEMVNIIEHLTKKEKVHGRTQVYSGNRLNSTNIVRNENGELELIHYNKDEDLPLHGQHKDDESKRFRKSDGQTSKVYQNLEQRLLNLGKKVRELYPNVDKEFILSAMKAIRKYAEEKKINTDKVIHGLKKGRYEFDVDSESIVPKNTNESKRRVIVVNESDMSKIIDMIEMTEQKFHQNMRYFISQLLADPVHAEVPFIFSQRNITRYMLLNYLLSGKDPILYKSERICDRDENGEPKTATMKVRFKCPKKNFDRKLQKLFIKMFEKNLPPRKKHKINITLTEDGAAGVAGATTCGASSGAFVTKMNDGTKDENVKDNGDVIRRQMPVELEETTATTNTGDYTYTLPVLGDKESCERGTGVGGSNSINIVKKNTKKPRILRT